MINVSAASMGKWLALFFIFLLVFHSAQLYCGFSENCMVRAGVSRLFNFDKERNVPTYYSTILLFTCCPLLYLHGVLSDVEQKTRASWMTLALIFLFLSMDESIGIHERISKLIGENLVVSGYLYFAWVIPYGILVVAFLLYFFNFLKKLPTQTFYLFIGSGLLYVSGAIGMEMLGANEASTNSLKTIEYAIYMTIEESLEISGISLFIFALVRHLEIQHPSLRFHSTHS